ncbi:uncharacterized protein LOC107418395 [Ziziphus jujuba]|uniref:Uncharacterized protein LOC107418395 n=1 Tax=Ziziphus jujuba TaxID=326968 RepID=A0A6P3ZPF0_ZIZJJ|nr:uncharacterized protein LOC107418395 [Ziziphus jujuba]
MQAGPLLSLSPSFNSYSSTGKLAEIAARVVNEFRQENNGSNGGGGFVYDPWENDENLHTQFGDLSLNLNSNPHEENLPQQLDHYHDENDEDHEGEFEFASVCRDLGSSSPISADELFYNGQIKPIYPLFNQDLLRNDDAPKNVVVNQPSSMDSKTPSSSTTKTTTTTRRRQPLRKLMIEEERESASTASCSSSESDELDGLSPESFCVWRPKTTAAGVSTTPERCKKSNSTGSSKRWKFRQLLSRSNSEGKDMFLFLSPSKKAEKGISSGDKKVAGKVTAKEVSVNGDGVGAHEAHQVKNRAVKEEDKKKSFLSYGQDIVGFFSNVDGVSRNLNPF